MEGGGNESTNFTAVSNAVNTTAGMAGATGGQTLFDSLKLINNLQGLNSPGTGLRIMGNSMGGLRIENFGIGVQVLAEYGISTFVDTANLGLATGATTGVAAVQQALGTTAATATPGYIPTYFSTAQYNALSATYGAATAQKADAQLAATPAAAGQQASVIQGLNTVQTSTGSIANNQSTLRFQGAAVTEVPLSYGYAINPNLSIGGSIKYMQAQITDGYTTVFNQNSNNFQTQVTQKQEIKTGFGIDLGIMYRMPNLQAGLVLRDLNSPKFKHSSGYVYEIKPQAKMGLSYIPWDTVTIELDADLTKNQSALSSYTTQYIQGGLEWNIFKILALRAGAYNNIAQNDIGVVYTAGLGINLWAARLDIGGAMSTRKALYQGKQYPREARASAALNIDF